MKIIIVSPKNRTVYNFRGDLIKEMVSLGHEVIVTGPDENHLDKILALGVKFELIKMNKTGVNPLADLHYLNKLKKLFKKERPDIVFGYTIKPVIYGSIAAKKAKVQNINAMITGAGYLFTAETFKAKLIRKIAMFLYKKGLKSADTVIFQNRDDYEEFINFKLVTRKKSRLVNGSGVNMKVFKEAKYPNQITFFMLARIMHSKGVIEYLNSAKIVKEKYPNVKFILLGAMENIQDSVNPEIIKEFVDKEIIEYFGETDNVKKFYKMSSVFVLPSYREGTPRTVLEAMSMGRPIITSDAPGCKDTVIDGKTGYLVPAKNIDKLVEAIEKFIVNPDTIATMGRASRLYCKEKYDVNKVNESMLDYIGIKRGQ